MIKGLLHFVIVAAAMMLLSQKLAGFSVTGWQPALIAAVVLGFANAILKPILFLLTLPLTLLTLGAWLIVLNVGMLWITQWLVPGFDIHGLKALLIGSIVLALVSWLWKAIAPDKRRDRDHNGR